MPVTIEQAIEALRNLSPARQEEVAGYICHLAADDREPEDIEAAHLPGVLEGLAQLGRGEFASTNEVEAAFRSFDE